MKRGTKILCGQLREPENPKEFGYCRSIKSVEVKGSIHRARWGRETRLDEISMEL